MTTETELVDQDTRARIRSIIVELAPDPEGARDDGATRLVEDLAYHSLALLELGFTLEDEFDLPPIDQEQVQHITTVEEIVDLVLGLLPEDVEGAGHGGPDGSDGSDGSGGAQAESRTSSPAAARDASDT